MVTESPDEDGDAGDGEMVVVGVGEIGVVGGTVGELDEELLPPPP